jgi:hypothetical protein
MEFFRKPRTILARVSAAMLGGAMLLAVPSPASAQDGEEATTEPMSLNSLLFSDTETAPFTVGGWTQLGYHDESNGLFNRHPDDVRLHQQYLYTERVADGTDGVDFGWRFDAIYGVDAQDTQAFGNPPDSFDEGWDNGIYGWALPQVYGEMAVGDFSVKAGHFYTIIGYESVMAPQNFFYSHAFTMYNNEPFTHTGVLTTYTAGENDEVTIWNGYTLGWDTGFDVNDDGDGSDGSNYIGGASLAVTEDITLIYATVAGDFGVRGEGYMHSFIVDVSLTEELNYVFQNDYLRANNVGITGGRADSYAFNQYLFYTVNENLIAGVRGEAWDYDGHTIYEITTGVNVRPWGPEETGPVNFVVRPEVRWQWAEDDVDKHFFAGNFGIPHDSDRGAIFGIDAILVY